MSVNVNPDYNKGDIRDLDEGTDLFFNSLRPVHYIYTGSCPCEKRHISLLPTTPRERLIRSPKGYISLSGEEGIRIIRHDDPYMRVSEQELIAVLWAKVRQLDDRVKELESR